MVDLGCNGKTSYATRRLCERAIARIKRSSPDPRKGSPRAKGNISSYFCPTCGGWHFGHMLKQLEQAPRYRRRFVSEAVRNG